MSFSLFYVYIIKSKIVVFVTYFRIFSSSLFKLLERFERKRSRRSDWSRERIKPRRDYCGSSRVSEEGDAIVLSLSLSFLSMVSSQ